LFISMLLSLCSNSVWAAANVADKDVCFYYAYTYEKDKGIRENLLSGIAIVETGRYDPSHVLKVYPWPWSVTSVKGDFFFDTKDEAVAYVRKLQNSGITSVDVGCMQVNLKIHGSNFASLEDAFEPAHNVAYAAKYVKQLYRVHKDWNKAGVAYHSTNKEKAEKYSVKLYAALDKLGDKQNKNVISDLVAGVDVDNVIGMAMKETKGMSSGQ